MKRIASQMDMISAATDPNLPEPSTGTVARYRAAVERTDSLIEGSQTPYGKTQAEIQARAERRMERLRHFLAYLGNPLDGLPIVHIGGTSGKGSTAAAVTAILTAAGYRVGLHTSPYLQVATEKLQIDGRLIGPDAFADRVDEVFAALDGWKHAGGEAITYGEFWVALVAHCFAEERLDVGVIEVGAGGRFDLTNVVQPAVSVITSVGLDHTVTLGDTIDQIAWHKAGIIKSGAPTVTAVTDPVAFAHLEAERHRANTTLGRVAAGETFEVLATGPGGTLWREIRDGAPIWSAPPGRYQATNAALAVAAVRALAPRFAVTDAEVEAGLTGPGLPGRFEPMPQPAGAARVVLDGAHNPQKIGALMADIETTLPRPSGGRRFGVVGVLETKDFAALVRELVQAVDELVVTSPRVLAKAGLDAETLAAGARAAGFHGPLFVEPDPLAAVDRALARVEHPDDAVLITGSLYLVGNVRGRWYPDAAILTQQTPWPRVAALAGSWS